MDEYRICTDSWSEDGLSDAGQIRKGEIFKLQYGRSQMHRYAEIYKIKLDSNIYTGNKEFITRLVIPTFPHADLISKSKKIKDELSTKLDHVYMWSQTKTVHNDLLIDNQIIPKERPTITIKKGQMIQVIGTVPDRESVVILINNETTAKINSVLFMMYTVKFV
jgi:hypothetical protein